MREGRSRLGETEGVSLSLTASVGINVGENIGISVDFSASLDVDNSMIIGVVLVSLLIQRRV